MKKMIKHHRGGVSLKERMLKNSRASRRLTKKESGAGVRRAESPGGDGEMTHHRLSTVSPKMTKTRRHQGDLTTCSHEAPPKLVDVEEGHCGSGLSSRECDAEEHVP